MIPHHLRDRSHVKVVLAICVLIILDGPRGGIWWCEACYGGGFLDHPPKGRHREKCLYKEIVP